MIVPMTMLAIGHTRFKAEDTMGLMLPLLVIGDLIAVWQYRRIFNTQVIRGLLIGSALGVVVGAILLKCIHGQPVKLAEALIEIEVGIESVALVGLHWYRTWRGNMEQFANPGPAKSNGIGALAGVSSTLAHAAGPIIALYLLPRKLDRRVFVGTCAIYFFMLNTAKLPAYWASSQFTREVLLTSAQMLPLLFVGAAFGFWLNRRMSDRIFSKIVYVCTFCLGFYLLYLGGDTLLAARHTRARRSTGRGVSPIADRRDARKTTAAEGPNTPQPFPGAREPSNSFRIDATRLMRSVSSAMTKPCCPGRHRLGSSVGCGGDDRHAHRQGLEDHQAARIVSGGKDKQIGRLIIGPRIGGRSGKIT